MSVWWLGLNPWGSAEYSLKKQHGAAALGALRPQAKAYGLGAVSAGQQALIPGYGTSWVPSFGGVLSTSNCQKTQG